MSGSLEPMSSGSDGEISHEKISHSGDSLVAPTVSDQLGEISAESPSLRTGSSNVLPNISSTTASSLENSLNESRDISPKREDEETTTVEEATRSAIREQATQLQLSLSEIAESIELVKADHDKLEKQNLALQDYIGGLTRSMSKGQGLKGTKSSSK